MSLGNDTKFVFIDLQNLANVFEHVFTTKIFQGKTIAIKN